MGDNINLKQMLASRPWPCPWPCIWYTSKKIRFAGPLIPSCIKNGAVLGFRSTVLISLKNAFLELL